MTSREIVERLINEHVINGEEAFTLINDICKNEMYDVWKTLEGSKVTFNPSTWTSVKYDPTSYAITGNSNGVATSASTYTVKGM